MITHYSRRMKEQVVTVLCLVVCIMADTYLTNPRGSNNRSHVLLYLPISFTLLIVFIYWSLAILDKNAQNFVIHICLIN